RRAGKGFGAEVLVLGRLIRDPEFGAIGGKLRDDGTVVPVDPEQYTCAESGLVKLDGLPAAGEREERGDGGVGGNRIHQLICPSRSGFKPGATAASTSFSLECRRARQ